MDAVAADGMNVFKKDKRKKTKKYLEYFVIVYINNLDIKLFLI